MWGRGVSVGEGPRCSTPRGTIVDVVDSPRWTFQPPRARQDVYMGPYIYMVGARTAEKPVEATLDIASARISTATFRRQHVAPRPAVRHTDS